ncbi:MAG: pgi [Gammaproteobacteria bacterium]|jgi:glucose-6-phosphate isomerase|nr:pgi [Gammaproteobacteria bacterium]
MKKLTEQPEWQALKAHQQAIASCQMHEWFKADPERFSRFSFIFEEILFDYSKNRITPETLHLLNKLADASCLKQKIEDLFSGQIVNSTEKRPALHTALRAPQTEAIYLNGQNINLDIQTTLNKMRAFTEKVRNKIWKGATGKSITDIVNIGIGGSHLGPLMTTAALADFAQADLHCHFISNIDSAHLNDVLKKINPESTLFIISSKSFSTLETMTHAETIRQWLQAQMKTMNVTSHFIAITAATEKALQFGIPNENIFTLWEWVGGRYSIWSAIGLPLALMIGMDRFLEFLAGGHAMDQHFRYSEFNQNIPVLMALLGIWYINFFGSAHHAIVPYTHRLRYLRLHLQQLDMESNGKSMTQQGEAVDFLTGPVILGEQGCNGQHAFHQLFHQGQHLIPVDFVLVGKEKNELDHHHAILMSSGLSQAKALMRGKSYQEALEELSGESLSDTEREHLAKHKMIPGNRPSNIIFLHRLTPYNLGALLALYEHKIFVQGVIWGINSFDQWGVELGKNLLPPILAELQSEDVSSPASHDSSTQGLIQYYKNITKLP